MYNKYIILDFLQHLYTCSNRYFILAVSYYVMRFHHFLHFCEHPDNLNPRAFGVATVSVRGLSCSSFLMHWNFPGESPVKENRITQKIFICASIWWLLFRQNAIIHNPMHEFEYETIEEVIKSFMSIMHTYLLLVVVFVKTATSTRIKSDSYFILHPHQIWIKV